MPSIKLIQIGILIAAVVAILATVYMRGRHDVQALWDAERAATAVVVAKIMADNKAREAQLQAAVDSAQTDMTRGIQDVEANLNRTIVDLRAGNRKLRAEYACTNPVPGAATGPSGAAGPNGTNPAARLAELCFRAAADGDKAIIQRNAAVEILKAERRP
jgi:hypothetical protein